MKIRKTFPFHAPENIFGKRKIAKGVLLSSIKKIAVFHMLPSGGGIRVLRQFTDELSSSFQLHIHQPAGASSARGRSKLEETIYPYPMWRKPSGYLRPVAPLFLILRLLSFKHVCRQAALNINRTADAVLVRNSMPVAAAPVLKYLNIPSAYFCFEHPRHIYEKDIIRRTSNAFTELALKPLALLEKRMDKQSARAATQIITFSEHMRKNVKSIYGRDAAIVRPGVDSTFFHPADKQTVTENYVLSVGALWPFKGHETAIRILSLINSDIRPEIRIVADRGYPGYDAKLFALASGLGVKVKIQQNITDEGLRELYRGAKAVICCQRREPYGLVPLEAMACGSPVLAINEGGFADNIINGKTGLLFPGTAETGAESLLKILAESEEITKMKAEGRHFAVNNRSIAHGTFELGKILESL